MRNISLGKYVVFATVFLSSTNSYAQSAFGVYDATNKFVGNLISQQLVGMIINGIVTALPFDVNGLQEGNGIIYFTTDDCHGSGYLDNQTVPPIGYYTGDNTVYYAKQPPENVTVASYFWGNNCYPLNPVSMYGDLAKTATIPHFDPPFSVR
jgi:hypothetical protein